MRMRRSNCLFFALAAWRRWGGYFAVRRTRHLVGWHWLVRHPRYDRWVAFEPLAYHATWWREVVAKLWYAGRVVRDDKPRRIAMKNPVLTLAVHVSTDRQKDAYSEVKTYKGMDDVQIAQFQAELSAAYTTVLQNWAKYLASK